MSELPHPNVPDVRQGKADLYRQRGLEPPSTEGCGCLLAPLIGFLIAAAVALYAERIEKLFTRTSAMTQPPVASAPQEPR